jgi:hypothetical protein
MARSLRRGPRRKRAREHVVQAAICVAEVLFEPCAKPFRQGIFVARPVFEKLGVHDLADIVQQPLMIGLVRGRLIVPALVHNVLLEREMGCDRSVKLSQEIGDFVFARRGGERAVQPVINPA